MLPLYTILFNIILDNNGFPNERLIGVIKPIFKKIKVIILYQKSIDQ